MQDSDDEELDQSGTPMDEGTGEAGGNLLMVDHRQVGQPASGLDHCSLFSLAPDAR